MVVNAEVIDFLSINDDFSTALISMNNDIDAFVPAPSIISIRMNEKDQQYLDTWTKIHLSSLQIEH